MRTLKPSRVIVVIAFVLAACQANPVSALAARNQVTAPGQATGQAPGQALPARDEPALQGRVDDTAPLRATPPPPGPTLPLPDENGITTINWDDLLPEGELERIEAFYSLAPSITDMTLSAVR